MTSRVEELQRMCDNINENGGLDSGEWQTALLAQIAQNLAVIADVMMADRKTESISEKPNNFGKDETQRGEPSNRIVEERATPIRDFMVNGKPKDEPTISKMEQVEDEPQTERFWCATCKYNEWDNMNPKCDECIVGEDKPSNYEPQTDCPWK